MSEVKTVTLIQTILTRRGDGTPTSPIRIITQWWTLDGKFVCEIDPVAVVVAPENPDYKKLSGPECAA